MNLEASHFAHLDIPAQVEFHTSTKLHPGSRSGKQWVGACPYNDCLVDNDGFIVWPELSSRGHHYYCRGCRRSGNIVKLLMDIRGYRFPQACSILEIPLDGVPTSSPSARVAKPVATDKEKKELEILQTLYHQARRYLAHERARAYLAGRGIPYELAIELGLAYLPPFADIPKERVTKDLHSIHSWFDRLIFPLTSSAGQGFTGRALAHWQEDIDENEHKELLKAHNIPRYMTTYLAGCFHAEILESSEHATFVEGPFDALALIAGDILDAVATCGTSLDALVIPLHLKGATLAYDGDESGRKAATDVRKLLRREVGILDPRICTPPDDGKGKDWNERYRLYGRAGLEPLMQPAAEPQGESSEPLSEDPLFYVRDVTPYQALPWYVPGEHDAVRIAEAALAWCFQCERSTDAVEVLACHAADMFEQQPGRAIAWLKALQQAYTARDQERLAALAQDVDMPGPELLALLPAQVESSPSLTQEQFLANARRMATELEQNTGVSWHVRILPKGFTLEDRIRELQQEEREQLRRAALSPRRKKAVRCIKTF